MSVRDRNHLKSDQLSFNTHSIDVVVQRSPSANLSLASLSLVQANSLPVIDDDLGFQRFSSHVNSLKSLYFDHFGKDRKILFSRFGLAQVEDTTK